MQQDWLGVYRSAGHKQIIDIQDPVTIVWDSCFCRTAAFFRGANRVSAAKSAAEFRLRWR